LIDYRSSSSSEEGGNMDLERSVMYKRVVREHMEEMEEMKRALLITPPSSNPSVPAAESDLD
jgi:hypothetical protein